MVLINQVYNAFMSELSLNDLTPNHQLQLTPMAQLNFVLGYSEIEIENFRQKTH